MKVPDELRDVLQGVTIECSSCDETVGLLESLTKDLGWGYFDIRGQRMWECPDCAGLTEEDEEDD